MWDICFSSMYLSFELQKGLPNALELYANHIIAKEKYSGMLRVKGKKINVFFFLLFHQILLKHIKVYYKVFVGLNIGRGQIYPRGKKVIIILFI